MSAPRGAIFLAALLAIAHSAVAEENPELRKATLEATAGQALYELGQMRASVVQLNQQIEALKAKCGEACKSIEPAAASK
jgi:hypothetical protein